MPKLLLEKNRLWMSRGENIFLFKRSKNYVQWMHPLLVLKNGHDKDVCNFVKSDGMLVSGGR